MITISKSYTKYRPVLNRLLQRCLAHKLTFFGFFYSSDLEHTKTLFKFENNINEGTRRERTIQKCMEMLEDWDGIMKHVLTMRTREESLYAAVQYFNSCPLSHIKLTDTEGKLLLERDVNLTVLLCEMTTPRLGKDFILKRKNTRHFYMEEITEGDGLYYMEFQFKTKDINYGLQNMSHYMEHQVFKYCSAHTLTGNALTDSFLTTQFYFTIEPTLITRFLDNVHQVWTQPFEERWDDFMEALRVSIETADEKRKEGDKNQPLALAFATNPSLIDNPDIHYISWMFHNNYELVKAVLEYSGPKYDNRAVVDKFMSLRLGSTEEPKPKVNDIVKQLGDQKVNTIPLSKLDLLMLFKSQFAHFSYITDRTRLIMLSRGIVVPDKKDIPAHARFIPWLWFPPQFISQNFVRRINRVG